MFYAPKNILIMYTWIWTPPYHPEFQPIEFVWADVKRCVARCFHINRGVKALLLDVKTGFIWGRCQMVDLQCPGVNIVSVQKKIRRSFRYAQLWGMQFYGYDFDLSSFWNTSFDIDINKLSFGKGYNEVVEIQFDSIIDLLDEEPFHWVICEQTPYISRFHIKIFNEKFLRMSYSKIYLIDE